MLPLATEAIKDHGQDEFLAAALSVLGYPTVMITEDEEVQKVNQYLIEKGSK